MAALIDDEDLRAGLVQRGRSRLSHFDPARSTATFVGHLADLA